MYRSVYDIFHFTARMKSAIIQKWMHLILETARVERMKAILSSLKRKSVNVKKKNDALVR